MEPVRIGIINKTINMLDFLLAEDAGIYTSHGLAVEFDLLGGLRSIEALLAGDLDVIVSIGATARAIMQRDAPLKVVQLIHSNGPHWVMGRASVTSVHDLKGGSVQAGDKGTEPDVMVRKWLTKNGLEPDVDVELTYEKAHSGWTFDGPAPAEDGAIARTLEQEALEDKGFTTLVELCTEFPDTLIHGLVVKETTLAERPDIVKNLIRSHREVSSWINDGREETVQFIERQWSVSRERAERAVRSLHGVFVARMDPNEFATIIQSSSVAVGLPPISADRLVAQVDVD